MTNSHHLLLFVVLLLGTLPLQQYCEGANVTNIRLANSQSDGRFGRLEIQVNGNNEWGVVCDDGWTTETDNYNAIVACRQLGFTNGGVAVLDDKYGRGVGPFLLDDTDCDATMVSLAQCLSAQQHNCGPADRHVGLECNANSGGSVTTFVPPVKTTIPGGVVEDNCNNPNIEPTVRLFGEVGLDGIGFVTVKNPNNNQWGFVCDDGWDSLAAKVVCAQLCFSANYVAKPGIPAEHRVIPTSPTIILDNVRCQGNEGSLQDCAHNNFAVNNNCAQGELAGVQCVPAEYKPPDPPNPVLECGGGLIKASFHRSRDSQLEEKHISVWGDPTCAEAKKSRTDAFISITIPVTECGTNLSSNGTHIIYENVIKYASTSQKDAITRFNTYKVSVTCAMPMNKSVTQRFQPVTEAVTVVSDGIITAGMAIYRSDSFQTAVTENPVRVPLGEWLNMAVAMEEYDSRLKIVVTDCVSTPTGDSSNTRLTKNLFINKCPEEETLSFYPLSNSQFAFRFKPFKFVNYPLLYIQCSAIVCLASDVTAECDRSCNNGKPNSNRRKKRSVLSRQIVQSPTIIIYDPLDPNENIGNKNDSSSDGDRTTLRPPVQQESPQPSSPPDLLKSSSPRTHQNTGGSVDDNDGADNDEESDLSDGLSKTGSKTSLLLPARGFVFLAFLCLLILF